MRFTYRWGQRPLDGYTIKRGLGQGGFGEVYFAVSDGGKEVALKLLVRGRTETELRGISNCLNFKHPNLVHLYDLQTDERGDHWLVMEYVHGEPLNTVLNRNAKGLPPEQARDWFLQVAKAVAYLHDHAVIHRDIKPGNVFVEHGMMKLGDYGLSKTVSSASLTQSANVGTVYYMAPEVGKGACTKQVDVYACGVMFYEMLTGEVPFRGDSWAEIALRHQTDLPELSRVPREYLTIIEKALNKKPENRYADMDEMIRAVEAVSRGGEHLVRQEEPVIAPETKQVKKPVEPPPLAKTHAAANSAKRLVSDTGRGADRSRTFGRTGHVRGHGAADSGRRCGRLGGLPGDLYRPGRLVWPDADVWPDGTSELGGIDAEQVPRAPQARHRELGHDVGWRYGRPGGILARRLGVANVGVERIERARQRIVSCRHGSCRAGSDDAPDRLHGSVRTRRRHDVVGRLHETAAQGSVQPWARFRRRLLCLPVVGCLEYLHSLGRSAGVHVHRDGRHGGRSADGQPVDAAAAAPAEAPPIGICMSDRCRDCLSSRTGKLKGHSRDPI